MMESPENCTDNPVQLDDFCRLCLLQKQDLRPLSSQIQTMLIPEMLFKVTGALLNIYDQLPRVICERCLMKLELAYSIAEEFRKQEDLLRSLWWKGALVDQLVAFQQSEESRRKRYSEEVIGRLAAFVEVDNVAIPDYQDRTGIEQQKTTTPVDNQQQIVKPELFEATEYSMQLLPEDSTDEGVEQPEQPNEIIDNGHRMVLELEDLRTIGALPDELLEQLDMQQIQKDATQEILSGGYVVSYLAESEEAQSDDDKDTYYVPNDEGQRGLASLKKVVPENEEGHENRLAEEVSEPNLGLHKCPICYRRYHSKHSFNYHVKRHEYIKQGKYRCKVCDNVFGSMSDLRRHEQIHELNSELRMTRDNIPPPIIINKDNKTAYKCEECQNESVNYFKYVKHAQRHFIRKTGMFQCQDCGKCYVIKKHLRDHQRKVHNLLIEPEPDDNETKVSNKPAPPVEIDKRLSHCSECDAFFLSKVDYKIHMRVHEPGYSYNQITLVNVKSEVDDEDCTQQEDATPLESPMAVPSTSMELNISLTLGSLWKCDECGETVTLRTGGSYQVHKRKHERIKNVTQKCEICKIAFSTRTALFRHRQENHGLVSHKERGSTEQCPLCKKQIPKGKLQKHNKTHENISLRKYVCVKCDTALGTPHHLKLHVKSGTCENPRYVPGMAEALTTEGLQEFFNWGDNQGSSTRAKSPIIIEVQNGHFKCKECDKLLKNFSSASKHARRHRLLKAGVFTCTICEKVFGAKSDMDRHIGHVHMK